ncbi:MAG: hypothetical protein H6767_00885 [Candidatus Peribacteria bacterium]|nr:MAG: hypothetical protein H6767_00885 [Candidatus Peribacteria bacterium]
MPGEHNQHNIQIVAKIAEIIGIPEEVFRAAVSTFQPLPHRLQNIGTYDEITFIDDAISTTPESTIEALKTYGSRVDTIFL